MAAGTMQVYPATTIEPALPIVGRATGRPALPGTENFARVLCSFSCCFTSWVVDEFASCARCGSRYGARCLVLRTGPRNSAF